ncbi:hypothetical protein CTAYLR_001868 [Chrysophaeum taylorii]|uniref:Mitochondrial carrier protein n=1 Tax=Chrysophaeum taylorii TaxID=2483200 RepID=A0AAD7U8B2_9STRA|nr:hypothetical protein CTAYLR_001868 [Chrysophaeum taylorii]
MVVGGATSRRVIEELPPLVVAAALTAVITYPVDFVRAMRMASAAEATSVAVNGLRYLSKGLAPELAKGTASRIIKFGGFPVAHEMLLRRHDESAGTRAIAGALATIPEIALITPLEVAKLALQLDAVGDKRFGNSLGRATRALVAAAGPQALYAGHFALQLRQAVWTSVYFAATPVFLARAPSGSTFATAAAGLAAGMLGALINNPIDVCRSVAQKDVLSRWVFDAPATTRKVAPYVGHTFAAGGRVLEQRGIPGLWAGSTFKAIHLGLGGALMAVLQPQCTAAWRRLLDGRTEEERRSALGVRGGGMLDGYHPFGVIITDLGARFLEFEGSRDSDLGRLLSSIKHRKRRATIKSEWLEIVRVSKSAQALRIYHDLDTLLNFLLAVGFLA